jgi:hypothetical protein
VQLAVVLIVIDLATASALLRLWPLILVGLGIGLVLRFSRGQALGGLIVAATFGLLGGVFLAGGVPFASGACAGGEPSGATQSRNGTAGATFELNAELTCGDMTIDRAPGGAWSVDVQAGDQTPTIDAAGTSLTLHSVTGGGFLLNPRERESWHVLLPGATELTTNLTVSASTVRANLGNGAVRALSATFNAADATLDFTGATANALSLSGTLNASSVSLILPAASVDGSLTINAGSLDICAAPDLGLRVTYDGTLSSNNFSAAGLAQTGKTWQSANYVNAATTADLHISANVSSVTLNPTGGCQ